MMAAAFKRAISEGQPADMLTVHRGIEKEGLRVTSTDHRLSQRPHPTPLGSALTHTSITTDYSESLLEFITGVHESPNTALEELHQLHAYTAQSLPDEIIWGASMPGELGVEAEIPIASYGTSNIGIMKRVYRNGLGARYGRTMQVIAGIHYNFSLPKAFWARSHALAGSAAPMKVWQTEGYLALIRNFQRHGWLLNFLTGSSPALSRSFIRGDVPSHLSIGEEQTLFGEFATSLRMGDLGYTSSAQDGLQICYNQIETYIETLTNAIMTPYEGYQSLSKKQNNELLQLNQGLLQIENEFYSAIRPKRVTQSGEAPLRALEDRGIEYVEVRCLDINPFTPLGLDSETIALVDTFLLSCILSDSPLCDAISRDIDNTNTQRILNFGRDPQLKLLNSEAGEVSLEQLAAPIMDAMSEAAAWLDQCGQTNRHRDAVAMANSRVLGTAETLSGRMLRELDERRMDYSTLVGEYSARWDADFQRFTLPQTIKTSLADEAITSLRKQREIEAADTLAFEDFLNGFYAQYVR